MSIRPLLLASVILLAACDSAEAPTGQVAAVVDGQEFTVSQVNAELSASGIGADVRDKELANRALDAAINRSILAEEARSRGLDKTPGGALTLKRAEEVALVELLRRDIQSKAPSLSDEEAQQFIRANPALFADRFVSIVEQVVVPKLSRSDLDALEAANTLDEVRAALDGKNIAYQTTMGSVDSLTVPPAIAQQIVDLGVGEVYIIPQGDGARINAVISKQNYPITGSEALELGRQLVSKQRSEGQAQDVFRSILTEKKSGARYSEEFAAPSQPNGEANGSAQPGAASE